MKKLDEVCEIISEYKPTNKEVFIELIKYYPKRMLIFGLANDTNVFFNNLSPRLSHVNKSVNRSIEYSLSKLF